MAPKVQFTMYDGGDDSNVPDPSFERSHLPMIETPANARLLADNFLDMAHFPFIHAGTFGAGEAHEAPNCTDPQRILL
jgi:vanillate O-demethylase monooxygenase subunit